MTPLAPISRRHFVRQALSIGAALALTPHTTRAQRPTTRVKLGIDVLQAGGFRLLRGQRVGLLTNQAGVNADGVSTISILHADERVRLVALFGPEHGIDGLAKADQSVANKRDPATGLPVFSLYGDTRKPTAAMLADIDVLVVDLQDIGSRSYTYVSALRYAMEACFEAKKRVVVLDRPNPLGGLKVDGPPLEAQWKSYVGAFPVPYVHGLTIGELARLAKAEPGVMAISDTARDAGYLVVIPMEGWRRDMLWGATDLRWVPTSPAIPTVAAVAGYSMTGLGAQLGGFRHGYGTLHPFRLLQFPGKSPEAIIAALRARRIPGLDYRVVPFEEKGEPRRGAYVVISDWQALRPTELSLHLMALACAWQPQNPFTNARESQRQLFLKHVGDSSLWTALEKQGARLDTAAFVAKWQTQARAFQTRARRWHLYD